MPGKHIPVGSSLGRAIIKSREVKPTWRKSKKADGDEGGYVSTAKSKEKNAKSVVEENDLDEFLAKADLAGTNFEAEHMAIQFISVDDNKLVSLADKEKFRKIEDDQQRLKEELRIPRRPKWTADMNAEELHANENKSYLEWRRELASLEQEQHVILTPFERNLEIWRQLWRVCERSDIIVQILDARNPLLFRCADLEAYVKELGAEKVNVLLINKADLLTSKQRRTWAQYFRNEGAAALFWSAASLEDSDFEPSTKGERSRNEALKVDAAGDQTKKREKAVSESESEYEDEDGSNDGSSVTEGDESEEKSDEDPPALVDHNEVNDGKILTCSQLIDLLKTLRPDKEDPTQTLTIGMVGYPNVGKSSTINKLIGQKKVAVSATPGKTKHFQTLFIDKNVCLCDCPGLVMPSVALSKEQMIIGGILPCDEMRDGVPAVQLICSQIDRRIFERVYGVILPKPGEYDDPNRSPTPNELLIAFAFSRGFMTSKGIPDSSRAARIIIKDYVNGRLRYCYAPPGVDKTAFDEHEESESARKITDNNRNEMLAVLQRRHLLEEKPKTADFDRTFFTGASGVAHVKTAKKSLVDSGIGKKHHNKNKKEKTRRLFGHLDA